MFILNLMFAYLVIVLSVTLISIAFRTCSGWVPVLPGAPAVLGEGGNSNRDESS